MSVDSNVPASQSQINTTLQSMRFELMPFDSFEKDLAHLPDTATIAITTASQLGIEKTVQYAEKAAIQGYNVVPHITARFIENRNELDDIATRLLDAGVTDILILGGDRENPKGEFRSAHDALIALDELGRSFKQVGIGGYPEGHQFLDEETMMQAIERKEPYATYIVTKLCLYPDTVIEWIEKIRSCGIDLPVEVGIPGVISYNRLLEMSRKVGIVESIKFLEKTMGVLGFIKEFIELKGTYKPNKLINRLAPYVDDQYYDIRGLNVYTFNQTLDTENWRNRRLKS